MKTMQELPERDRPREKMRLKGAAALTSEELVQVILGRGVKGHDVRAMSQKIARIMEEKKGQLAESDLVQIHGMGEAKSYQLLAAFEIARRFAKGDAVKITGAQDILALDVIQQIAGKQQEHFVCISLNGANEVVERRIVTVGLLDRSQVHPREVFADVIADRAAAVIFAHNLWASAHKLCYVLTGLMWLASRLMRSALVFIETAASIAAHKPAAI
ncbi:MAG: hypothetical protein HYY23_08565 [Verrucomicrobia bacterium]|nr:hypothetical protein [Verrucomicrobiota bacterium]